VSAIRNSRLVTPSSNAKVNQKAEEKMSDFKFVRKKIGFQPLVKMSVVVPMLTALPMVRKLIGKSKWVTQNLIWVIPLF